MENMSFYTSIHQQYDFIFPLNPNQVSIIESEMHPSSKILDIGCATGNLAIEIAKKGMQVNAFDLDAQMIELAKQKLNSEAINFRVSNMLNISTDYAHQQFSGVICFGNTLVHLTNKNLIEDFIKAVNSLLKNGGKFILQILNYDYILNEKITELPVIENDKIKFVRKYEFMENGLLNFITHLTIKENKQVIDNQIELLPITKNEIIKILADQGFSAIQVFGNFAKMQLNETSLPLVVTATK